MIRCPTPLAEARLRRDLSRTECGTGRRPGRGQIEGWRLVLGKFSHTETTFKVFESTKIGIYFFIPFRSLTQ